MAEIGAKIPWKVWCRIHAKAIAQALPLSFLIVVEARDMYYRSTWQVHSLPSSAFRTGDVIAISNRWYTMPTWNHVLYSLMSKVLLKSCWDDVAVVSSPDPTGGSSSPSVLFCDFEGAHEMTLDEFIKHRRPRGMAIRQLQVDHRDEKELSDSISTVFKEEVVKLEVHPWYLFNASRRLGHENKYYEFCVGMHEQRVKIRKMIERGQSREAIAVQQQKLQDMDVLRQHLRKFVKEDYPFQLFNGSLVASFLAAFGLIDRQQPPPTRYVPQDFAHTVPFLGATELKEPVVFYRS